MTMRFLVLVSMTLVVSRADARTCSTLLMGYHGNTVYAEDVVAIDAALPCSNVISSFPGPPEQALAFGNIRGVLSSSMFNAIARRNEMEMNCRTGYYDRMLAGDRDQLTGAAIDRFVQLRREFGASRDRIRREEASRNEIIRNAGGDRLDRQSATMGNAVVSSLQIDRERKRILAGVPFGYEPDVQEALLRLDEQLPENFYEDPAAVARFENAYRASIQETRRRYNAGARYMNGRFRTMYVRNPSTGRDVPSGGYYEPSDDIWTAFDNAGSFEDLAASLQRANRPISAQNAHRMVCTLEMMHGDGSDDGETAVTTSVGVAGLFTGPAAPFVEAGVALYYSVDMVQQCFFTPDIDVVRGQACVEGGTLDTAIQSANNNRCAGAAVPVIAGAAGAALTFRTAYTIVRNADGAIVGLRPATAETALAARRATTRVLGPDELANESTIQVTANLSPAQWRVRAESLAARLRNLPRGRSVETAMREAGYSARSGAPNGFQKFCSEGGFCLTVPQNMRSLTRAQERDLAEAFARRPSGNTEWIHPDARRLASTEVAPANPRVATPGDDAARPGRTAATDSESAAPGRTTTTTPQTPVPPITAAQRTQLTRKYQLELNASGENPNEILPIIAQLERQGIDDATIRATLTRCEN